MAYSDDEITASVEQLVRSTIRRPYDTLGVRRTDVSFTDIQEAAAGVFLLYSRAPFYCVFLGSLNTLERVISESSSTLSELERAVLACGRRVLPIDDLTPLFNARAALRELAGAAASRTASFKDITKVPAYQRYSDNTDRFLNTSGQAVKEAGDVVDTPQGARTKISVLVTALKDRHQDLVLTVAQLAKSVENFNELNLSALVAASVIQNATTLVGSHADALALLTPDARLEQIRQTVLDVIAARSVVKQFGSFGGVADIHTVTGTGAAYADADHPAIPAQVTASIKGSYNIAPGVNTVDLYLDDLATPRSLSAFVARTALPSNQATFDVGGPVPVDVLINDIIYVEEDPTTVTKWTILSINPTTIVAQGYTVATVLGAFTAEVLPPVTASISLPYSFAAQIQGVQSEQVLSMGTGWIIGNGTNPIRPTVYGPTPTNNQVRVNINGTFHTIPLTISVQSGTPTVVDAAPRTAQNICDDINAVLNAFGYTASPYLAPRRFYGKVNIVFVSGMSATMTLQGGFGNFGSLGVVNGDLVQTLSGSQLSLWIVTNVAAQVLTVTKQSGPAPVNELGAIIEVGPAQRRVQILAMVPRTAVANLDFLGIVGETQLDILSGAAVGLPVGGVSRSRMSTAKEVASALTTSSSLIVGKATFVPTMTIRAHGNAKNSTLLSVSRFTGVGDLTFIAGAPNTLTVAIAGALTAGVIIGDILVQREGTYPGGEWTVTAVTDSLVTAQRTGMLGVTEASVLVEIGPDLGLVPFDMVRIESGVNQGDYYISATAQLNKLDWYLTGNLPLPTAINGLNEYFELNVGSEYVTFSSNDKTTASRVKVRGTSYLLFFPSGDPLLDGVVGSSTYFLLPQVVRGLEVGDLLQLYETNYNVVTTSYVIAAIEGRIITLNTPIPDLPTWEFGTTAQVPFARLHLGHMIDFTSFKVGLDAWLVQVPQKDAYWTELYRRINPIISNVNPTAVEIGDALSYLRVLKAQLTAEAFLTYGGTITPLETVLENYKVDPVAPVDALIRSFKEKGADRAIDLLLGGLFQDFFNSTATTSSYAGDFQEKMRAVAMKDLPVNKSNRADSHKAKLIGSTETPDTEYNLADTEGQGVRPDPI